MLFDRHKLSWVKNIPSPIYSRVFLALSQRWSIKRSSLQSMVRVLHLSLGIVFSTISYCAQAVSVA